MSVIDKIKLDGTTYDVGKTPDTTLAVSGSPADAATVGTELNKKVDKVTGKGLSTEDFTTAEKTKLAGIAEGATNIVIDTTLTQSGQAADAKATGDALATKVAKPITSPNGTNGQLLRTLGNGKTEWTDFATPTSEQVGEAVEDWLNAHPEATTTVQDGAITEAKLDAELYNNYQTSENSNLISKTVSPIYLGDYTINNVNYLPSVSCKVGDLIYAIDAPNTDYAIANQTDMGILRVFDFANNQNLDTRTKNIEVGHANSICYDSENEVFYIAPVFSYVTGVRNSVQYILRYDASFENMSKISTPNGSVAMSVTYDPVQKKLYMLDYQSRVWIYANGQFTLYSILGSSTQIDVGVYNQDFCVYDDNFYWSSPRGYVKSGKLTPNESDILNIFVVNWEDYTHRFFMGELEGFEFDSDGHLIATKCTREASSMFAFVVEIPTAIEPYVIEGINYSVANYTLTIDNTALSQFTKTQWRISSLNNIRALLIRPTDIKIDADLTESVVYIDDDIIINVNANFTLEKLLVKSADVNLSCGVNGKYIFTASDYCIANTRSSKLTFSGSTFNLELPNINNAVNNLVKLDYDSCITIIRTPLNYDYSVPIYIGTAKIYSWTKGMFKGSDKIGDSYADEYSEGVIRVVNCGLFAEIKINISNASGYTFGQVLATLPEKFIPFMAEYIHANGRNGGDWAGSTYSPVVINISSSNGKVTIYGKDLKNLKYLTLTHMYKKAYN